MGRINEGVLHAYADGETVTAEILNSDHEIIRTAINDNNDRVAILEAAGGTETLNVNKYGAKGDNTTDDTDAFRKAIDAAIANQQPLYIPPGTYILRNDALYTEIPADKSLVLIGAGPMTVLKRKDGSITQNGQQLLEFCTSDSVAGDAESLVIRDLMIDGNARGNPLPDGNSDPFLWEHCASLMVYGGFADAVLKNFTLYNVIFYDPVADNVYFAGVESCYIDSINVSNVYAYGRTRTRSDFTLTGGVGAANFSNLVIDKFETEFEGAYNGTYECVVNLENAVINQKLDIAGLGDTLIFNANNIYAADFEIQEVRGRITNSTLRNAKNKVTADFRFNNIFGLTIANTDIYFPINDDGTITPLGMMQRRFITFENCQFLLDTDDPANVTGHPIIVEAEADPTLTDTRFIRCCFDKRFSRSLTLNLCGNVYLKDNVYAGSAEAIWVNADTVGGIPYAVNLVIDGGDWDNVAGKFIYFNVALQLSLEIKNVEIPYEKAAHWERYPKPNSEPATLVSNRILYKDSAPTNDAHGMKGDIVKLKTPLAGQDCMWICTLTSDYQAEWQPIAHAGVPVPIAKGVTSLPTASASLRGYIYMVHGGAGVADVAYICTKDAADTYVWTPIT